MTNKKLTNMVMKLKRDVKHLRRLTMSQIPKDTQSKYNKDNKFGWVDSQLEKFMTEQKELKDEISELEKENKKQKEKYNRLYKLYTEGTPTDGLEVGSPEDYK